MRFAHHGDDHLVKDADVVAAAIHVADAHLMTMVGITVITQGSLTQEADLQMMRKLP